MASVHVDQGRLVAKDGVRLSWWWHRPEGARATLLVHHGFAEHAGRYRHVVDAMTTAGFEVVVYDARGHGDSGGRRGHVDAFADYVDDLRAMIAMVTERSGRPPLLLAHSQGGLIVCDALREGPLAVRGIAMSNPALAASIAVPAWKIFAARTLSSLLPTLAMPIGIPPEAISRDAESVRDYRDDGKIFDKGTTRWGAEFLAAQERVLAAPLQLDMPLLVLLGTGDRVVDPAVSSHYFQAAQAAPATIKTFDGFYHELFNEPLAERLRALAALRDWALPLA